MIVSRAEVAIVCGVSEVVGIGPGKPQVFAALLAAGGLLAWTGEARAAQCSAVEAHVGCETRGGRTTRPWCDCSAVVDPPPGGEAPAGAPGGAEGADIGIPAPSDMVSTPIIQDSPFTRPPGQAAAVPPGSAARRAQCSAAERAVGCVTRGGRTARFWCDCSAATDLPAEPEIAAPSPTPAAPGSQPATHHAQCAPSEAAQGCTTRGGRTARLWCDCGAATNVPLEPDTAAASPPASGGGRSTARCGEAEIAIGCRTTGGRMTPLRCDCSEAAEAPAEAERVIAAPTPAPTQPAARHRELCDPSQIEAGCETRDDRSGRPRCECGLPGGGEAAGGVGDGTGEAPANAPAAWEARPVPAPADTSSRNAASAPIAPAAPPSAPATHRARCGAGDEAAGCVTRGGRTAKFWCDCGAAR